VYEGLFLGLAIVGLFWLVMWSAGVRPRLTPSRESLAFVALGLALWLVLRASAVFDPSTSVIVGFVAAAIVLGVWRRFARPI
jgi:hypothetical protein